MHLRFFFIYFLCLCSNILNGQNNSKKLFYDKFRYNVETGFDNSQLLSIIQDNYGYVWVGGVKGLTRFNSKEVKTYTTNDILNNNITTSLFIDKKGILWQGAYNNSPAFYNGSRFVNYSTKDTAIWKNMYIYNFGESDRIFFASTKGIFYLNNDRINPMFSKWLNKKENIQSAVYFKGIYYIATTIGLYASDNKSYFKKIYAEKYLQSGGSFSIIKNTLYYSCQNILKLKNGLFTTILESKDPLQFTSINVDKQGHLWFAKKYIYKLNGSQLDSIYKSKVNELCYDFCYLDKDERIWVNFTTMGIDIWSKKNIQLEKIPYLNTRYTNPFTNNSQNKQLHFIDNRDGSLAAINSDGSNRRKVINSPIFNTYYLNNALIKKNGEIILTDGNLTQNILKYSNKKITKIYAPPNTKPFGIIENSSGLTLTAGNEAIYKIERDSLKPFISSTAFKEPLVKVFEDQQGDYWIIGLTKIYFYDKKKITDVSSLIKERDIFLLDIVFFQNKIILSTRNGGIYIFEKLANKLISAYDHLTKEKGILNNEVTQIMIDNYGNCLTQNDYDGFNYISNITNKKTRQIFTIDKEYLKSINIKNIELLYQDKESGICKLFVDSTLITFDSTILKDNKTDKFPLVLEEIELFKTKQNWAKSGFIVNNNIPKNLILNYSDNFLTFYFQAIDFNNSLGIKYFYKLSSSDTSWIGPIFENNATYNNIQPGKYTFQVKAVRPNNSESEILKYTFTINPPWWNTWWFRTFYVMLIIGSILFYIRYKTIRLKKQNILLNRKVFERTKELQESVNENEMLISTLSHDIRGPLADMQRVTDLMSKNWNNLSEENKIELIHDINISSALTSSFTSNFLIWIKAQKSNNNFIETFNLNDLIEEIVNFQLKCNNPNGNTILIKHHSIITLNNNKIFLRIIIYNLIDNALKYTINGKLEISTVYINNVTKITILDNGKGMTKKQVTNLNKPVSDAFNQEENEFNLGWKIIKDLAIKIGAKTNVTSNENGTTVVLEINNV